VDASEVLKNANTLLVIDWPSRDVPESLARAGLEVFVRTGPGARDYSLYQLDQGGGISIIQVGRPPDKADLIYCFRPLSELPGIIATAQRLHAKTLWMQSGFSSTHDKDPKGCWMPEEELRSARELSEAAGLIFLSEPYIGDVARKIIPAI
jgi:predicted CoA-binding protein